MDDLAATVQRLCIIVLLIIIGNAVREIREDLAEYHLDDLRSQCQLIDASPVRKCTVKSKGS
jgi:hypothetical protein